MRQSHSSKAESDRRRAKSCEGLAACALSADDRDRRSRFRDSYLSLAANEERLGGLPPIPAAQAAALAG
jgi:hypothetical protein